MRNSKRIVTIVRRWICWAIACFCLVGCQPSIAPESLMIQVGRVISGQELETVGLPNQAEITERLSLAGIAAPAPTVQPWGGAAKTKLEELTAHQSLRLESEGDSQSGQGRGVYLWRDGQLLNELLVAEGYAIVLPLSAGKYRQRLNYAQDRARILGLGVWNPEKPLRQLSQNTPE